MSGRCRRPVSGRDRRVPAALEDLLRWFLRPARRGMLHSQVLRSQLPLTRDPFPIFFAARAKI